MATHSSVLAWKIPWTEGPGGLQSTGSHRVRHEGKQLITHAGKKSRAEYQCHDKYESYYRNSEAAKFYTVARWMI